MTISKMYGTAVDLFYVFFPFFSLFPLHKIKFMLHNYIVEGGHPPEPTGKKTGIFRQRFKQQSQERNNEQGKRQGQVVQQRKGLRLH